MSREAFGITCSPVYSFRAALDRITFRRNSCAQLICYTCLNLEIQAPFGIAKVVRQLIAHCLGYRTVYS